jgi:lipopolysaccharide transport system ATP-binding protein
MSVQRSPKLIPGQPLIELCNVSRHFVMQREHRRSFQESFIRFFRGQRQTPEIFWPLREVSFTVQAGDCIGVIGPNGAGKSTLLKLITGILAPTAGEMRVSGRISSLLELGAGFHPDLTGRENIYLNGSIYGLSRAQMNKRLDAIIDYAELGDFIDTPIKHYSSGMYVRLGFAVAIHTDPDLLLVDEVLAVGDATFQRKCINSIQRFRDNGGTLFLVSHDLATIQSICKRAIWLEHGAIQADGHPTDVAMAYLGHLAQLEEEKAERAAKEPTEDEETASDEAGETDRPPAPVRRWGTGQIQVNKVELCDAQGQPHATFRNGDPLTIRLHYKATTRVEKPVFGLAIHHQNGTHICGPNTKFGELTLEAVEGEGVISYQVAALPLLEGSYTLSVAVADQALMQVYDYHDRLYQLEVYRGRSHEQFGLVTLNGSWSKA